METKEITKSVIDKVETRLKEVAADEFEHYWAELLEHPETHHVRFLKDIFKASFVGAYYMGCTDALKALALVTDK